MTPNTRLIPQVLLATALAVGLAACSDGPRQETGPRADADGTLHYGDIAFEPCSLRGGGNQAVEAQCATVEVPENHDAPEGRKIELALALVPAEGMAEDDPIFLLAGGPGQAAREVYPAMEAAFADVHRNRHVLLLDARGTGGSNLLQCATDQDEDGIDDFALSTPDAMRVYARRCRDALSKKADLRFYTTGDIIRDLDLVREKLGVARVNLIGGSYGTRVAQQYAATYPEHTRAVVLDSVAPNTLVLGQDHARNLEDGLDLQFERCLQDKACKANLGNPREQLALVRERLQAGGIAPVRYRDPVSGEWHEEVPTYGHLSGLLRMYSYQPAMAATLPLVLHEAAQGRYESLLAQARMLTRNLGDAIAIGMSLSVTCSEDASEFTLDERDSGTVMGQEFVASIQAACAVWPKGERAADFREPLTGDVPVLAISGEFDPVTPPRYGDEVIEHLPNGRHLVLPGQGHTPIGVGCMPKLFAQFIENADAKALDAGCLDRLSAQPPFAGSYGWEP